MTSRTQLGISRNNVSVWYDPEDSHTATHITDTPELTTLAREVISGMDLDEPYIQTHVDLGRIVGMTDLVAVGPGDEVMYAKRRNRDTYTPFNMSRSPESCSLLTVALARQDDATYELVSTWIGPSDSPSMPGTERETADSRAYWNTHALAWGRQEIEPGTETTVCPW